MQSLWILCLLALVSSVPLSQVWCRIWCSGMSIASVYVGGSSGLNFWTPKGSSILDRSLFSHPRSPISPWTPCYRIFWDLLAYRRLDWLRNFLQSQKHTRSEGSGILPNSVSTPPPSSKRTLCGNYFRRKSVNFLKQWFWLWEIIFWQWIWSNFVLRWYSDGYHDR